MLNGHRLPLMTRGGARARDCAPNGGGGCASSLGIAMCAKDGDACTRPCPLRHHKRAAALAEGREEIAAARRIGRVQTSSCASCAVRVRPAEGGSYLARCVLLSLAIWGFTRPHSEPRSLPSL